jgi:hypothetical protein
MRVALVAEQADSGLPRCLEFPAVLMPNLHREPHSLTSVDARFTLAQTRITN